jgi:hypothetical protein
MALGAGIPILEIDEGIGLPNPLMTEGTLGIVTQNFSLLNNLVSTILQETPTSLASATVHFDFFSSVAPAAGVAITNNTNFVDADGTISDTVSVTLLGHLLDANGNNTSATIQFLSDSLNETLRPTPLANAATIGENGFYDLVTTGVPQSDLNFSVRSDLDVQTATPEPSTLGLALFGICGALVASRCRRSTSRSAESVSVG